MAGTTDPIVKKRDEIQMYHYPFLLHQISNHRTQAFFDVQL
ncbi:hypothetical protein [Aurantivibrio infirmus]